MVLDIVKIGVSRDRIHEALQAEGVVVSKSYQNIHLLPLYQQKIAYGSSGFPWSSDICQRDVDYRKGICPVAEELNDSTYLGFGICGYELGAGDVDLIVSAFQKVWRNLDALRES